MRRLAALALALVAAILAVAPSVAGTIKAPDEHTGVLVVLAIVAVAVAGSGIWWFFRNRNKPPGPPPPSVDP